MADGRTATEVDMVDFFEIKLEAGDGIEWDHNSISVSRKIDGDWLGYTQDRHVSGGNNEHLSDQHS